MADAAALEDFAIVIVFGVALAISFLAYQLSRAIVAGVDVEIPVINVRPFHGIATALENSIVSFFHDAYQGAEKEVTKGFSGLIDSFGILIGLTYLLGVGIKDGLEYLWVHSLPGFIAGKLAHLITSTGKAVTGVAALEAVVARDLVRAESYAAAHSEKALHDARAYADGAVAAAVAALTGEIHTAESDAQAAAAAAAAAAVAAAHAASTTINKITNNTTNAITETITQTFPGLNEAVGAIEAELPHLPSLDWDKLSDLLNGQDLAKIGGLLAAIPMLNALVHALANEAGLSRPECRRNVKQICGTNPSRWAGLIEGLAELGFVASLPELARLANGLAPELVPLIRQAA